MSGTCKHTPPCLKNNIGQDNGCAITADQGLPTTISTPPMSMEIHSEDVRVDGEETELPQEWKKFIERTIHARAMCLAGESPTTAGRWADLATLDWADEIGWEGETDLDEERESVWSGVSEDQGAGQKIDETNGVGGEHLAMEIPPPELREITTNELRKFSLRRPRSREGQSSQSTSEDNTMRKGDLKRQQKEIKEEESHSTPLDLSQSHLRNSSSPTLRRSLLTSTILFLLMTSLCSTTEARGEATIKYDLEKREYDPELKEPVNFTAFDCTKPKPGSWRGIDLTQLGQCPDIDHDYEPVEYLYTSLVQSGLAVKTDIIQCDLQITQTVHKHDGHLHYGRTGGGSLTDNRRAYFSGRWCRELFKHKKFRCPDQVCGGNRDSPVIDIRIGEETQAQYYAAGDYVDGTAYPDGFHHRHDGRTSSTKYNGVLEVLVKIKVSKHPAYVDYQADRIWSDALPFQAKYSVAQSAVNIDRYGTVAWTHRKHECSEQLGLISTSSKTAIRRLKFNVRPGNGLQEYAGALAILTNDTEQRASGVVISGEEHHCMKRCYLTNIPQLLMCVGVRMEGKVDPIEERVLDSTTIARINAQAMGTYLQLTSKLDILSISRLLQRKICELDSRATRQDFAMLLNGRSPYALQGLATGIESYPIFGHNGTAYTFSIRGSTAYFAVCPEEEVQLVSLPKCSLQIPIIRRDGSLAFADAINRHIVDLPTWVECDSGLPVQYHINGMYYCQGVNNHNVCSSKATPTVLKPSIGKVRGLKVDELPPLAGLTINPRQSTMISEIVREQEYGRIIEAKLVHATIVSTDEVTENNGRLGIHLGIPLSGIDIELVAGGVASQLFYLFNYLGNIYLNFFGVVFAISITRQIIFFWIRVYQVTRVYGCGKWLFFAFFNSLWVTFAMPSMVLKSVYKKADEEFNKLRVDDMPIPDNAQLAREQKRLCAAFANLESMMDTIYVLNHGTLHPSGVTPTDRKGPDGKWDSCWPKGSQYSRLEDGLLPHEGIVDYYRTRRGSGGGTEYRSLLSLETEDTVVGQEESRTYQDQGPQGQVSSNQGTFKTGSARPQGTGQGSQGTTRSATTHAGPTNAEGSGLTDSAVQGPFSRGGSDDENDLQLGRHNIVTPHSEGPEDKNQTSKDH